MLIPVDIEDISDIDESAVDGGSLLLAEAPDHVCGVPADARQFEQVGLGGGDLSLSLAMN